LFETWIHGVLSNTISCPNSIDCAILFLFFWLALVTKRRCYSGHTFLVMQQAFGAFLVRYSRILGGESVRPISSCRRPLASYLPLSSCLRSVAGESVKLFFCFMFVQRKL